MGRRARRGANFSTRRLERREIRGRQRPHQLIGVLNSQRAQTCFPLRRLSLTQQAHRHEPDQPIRARQAGLHACQ